MRCSDERPGAEKPAYPRWFRDDEYSLWPLYAGARQSSGVGEGKG